MKLINFYYFTPLNDLIEKMNAKSDKKYITDHSSKPTNLDNNENQLKAKDIFS